MRRLAAAAALTVLAGVLLVPAGTAAACTPPPPPALELSARQVPAGGTVRVSGGAFGGGCEGWPECCVHTDPPSPPPSPSPSPSPSGSGSPSPSLSPPALPTPSASEVALVPVAFTAAAGRYALWLYPETDAGPDRTAGRLLARFASAGAFSIAVRVPADVRPGRYAVATDGVWASATLRVVASLPATGRPSAALAALALLLVGSGAGVLAFARRATPAR